LDNHLLIRLVTNFI